MTKYYRWFGCCTAIIILALALSIPTELKAAPTKNTDQFLRGWLAYDEGRFNDAFLIWQRLAKRGDANAQVNLGAMYDNGKGVSEDPVKAVDWYRRAALQGNSGAQYNLGLMRATGRGVSRNIDQAAKWYRKAADQGLASAQYNLGILYGECLGGQSDVAQPAICSQENSGFKPDQSNLGSNRRSTSESGADYNEDLAVKWLSKAALSFLEGDNTDAAWTAVNAINKVVPGHAYVRQLLGKIHDAAASAGKQPQVSPESFAGASIGTAWPIEAGYVVTNNHVITESTDVVLVNVSGHKIRAWPVIRDELNDIAILKVDSSDELPPALPLARSKVRLGTSVFTLGFPRIDVLGRVPKLSDGVISGLQGVHDDPKSYQTTVPIQPGNSGGPLLNMNGEVVGVVTSMVGVRDETHGNIILLQNASNALKVECVKDLLRMLPKQGTTIGALPRRTDDIEMLAERVSGSVLIVVAK